MMKSKIHLFLPIVASILTFSSCSFSSSPQPETEVSKTIPRGNWDRVVLKSQEHQQKRDAYFSAYRETKNFTQLHNAINESEEALRILYSLQQRYPRGSDLAYQTLLKRLKNCKSHQNLLQKARENLIKVRLPDPALCRFTFQ